LVDKLHFEDFAVGQRLVSGAITLTAERIIAFAEEFDPQEQHLSHERARASLFGELVASGLHTIAVSMRLVVDVLAARTAGAMGAGITEIRWPQPTRAGDTVHTETEIAGLRPSASKPHLGVITLRTWTYNQRREVVQEMTSVMLLRRRDGGPAPAHPAA
jgi:acyl dehydratase